MSAFDDCNKGSETNFKGGKSVRGMGFEKMSKLKFSGQLDAPHCPMHSNRKPENRTMIWIENFQSAIRFMQRWKTTSGAGKLQLKGFAAVIFAAATIVAVEIAKFFNNVKRYCELAL